MTDHAAIVPPVALVHFGAGEPVGAVAGDVLIVRTSSRASGLIVFGEKIHDHEAWADHCVCVLDNGEIAQAEGKGIELGKLADFTAADVTVVHPTAATPEQIAAAICFGRWSVGIPYGWTSIGADAVNDLTGSELDVEHGLGMVCSTHACRFAERWGLVPDRNPYAVQPDDMANYFGAIA